MSLLTDEMRVRLDGLIRSDRVVLFMKGTRDQPQCGFSARVVEVLDGHLPEYNTINILDDMNLREALKEYASWPTYPQLWVDGEFVGGADIVGQMASSGELAALLGADAKPPPPIPTLTVTDACRDRIRQVMENANFPLRLSIDARFQYGFQPVQEPSFGDVVVVANGLQIVMDRASAARANGVSLDYVSGPRGSGIVVDNPNEPPRVRQMQPEDLKPWIDRREDFVLVDVRTDGEAEIARIPGARLLDEETETWLGTLPKDTKLVFQCHHGVRSAHAAEHFLRQGFKLIWNLTGGIDAWSTRIDPTVPRY
jgi:monothiol glutaredoxin